MLTQPVSSEPPDTSHGREGSDTRPVSDVSSGVGISGLAGLLFWIAFCRNWPAIAELLQFPGPMRPLDGPYAALLAAIFTGIPMVLWSLFIDKVHLRPTTGIDWRNPRPAEETFAISLTKIVGLWATWGLIATLYWTVRWYWQGQQLFAMDVLGMAAVPLFSLSVPYVLWMDRRLVEPRDEAWHFGAMLIGRERYRPDEVRNHLRAWAVKGFFCAFMISILPPGFAAVVSPSSSEIAVSPVSVARWAIELLFVVDVQIAMIGYFLTVRPLDAHIRTANPYLAGWLAALICYPPFLLMGDGGLLDYRRNSGDWTYWLDGRALMLGIWGALLVFLAAVYAWSTVIYGIRFSNLTHRGVVTNGPYRFTRHPAYLSKNLFWWCSTMPFIATSHSWSDMVRNSLTLVGVSAVYYWRAKTEERHLLAEDVKYREYHHWMERNAPITRSFSNLLRHRVWRRDRSAIGSGEHP